MIVTKITNHVEVALQRLLQQYQGQPNIAALLTALVEQIQDLEDAFYPLDQLRQLTYAFGQQLDNLGEIIGLKRNGLLDNEYFILLLGEIAKNNSDTTAPALLNIVQTVFQASNVFIKTPNSVGVGDEGQEPPATVAFGVGDPQAPTPLTTVIQQIIQASIAAGVNLVYLSSFNHQYAFSTAGPQAWCSGCSDLNNPLPTDGQIASLIYNNPGQ